MGARALDGQADAHFDAVESSPHGFVLRGWIGLSPRHMMWVQVDKLVDGVRAADRADAGLLVVVVLREGLLGRGGAEITAPLERLVERLDVPPIITEDA